MINGRPIRVLYSFPHPVGSPGIGVTALNQVGGLAAAGAEVTLVCTSLHSTVPESVEVIETLRMAGRRIPHRALGSPDRALWYHDRRVAKIIGGSNGQFDVVHTWPQSAIATLTAARRTGVLGSREVPNAHTAEAYAQAELESKVVGVDLPAGHSHLPSSRRLALEEREYDAAQLLMVPSSHVASTFLHRGYSESRLGRHRYGYDPNRFGVGVSRVADDRPFRAAFVGRAEPRKGLHYALQAWLSMDPPSEAKFRIAGDFTPGYRDSIGDMLNHPSVEYRGFVEDVPDLLRTSDVLLLPSVEEGSALVTYEAQACGCVPLVSSAAGALLPPSLMGYVHEPRDVKTLARHLQSVMYDAEIRRQLRDDILTWSTGLTWDAAGRRMLDIFEERMAGLSRS